MSYLAEAYGWTPDTVLSLYARDRRLYVEELNRREEEKKRRMKS